MSRQPDEHALIANAFQIPLGEVYLPCDPPQMFKAIQATGKPCLAYKVLAAGRRVDSAKEVYAAFQTAFRPDQTNRRSDRGNV